MATTTITAERVELSDLRDSQAPIVTYSPATSRTTSLDRNPDEVPEDAPYSTTAIPDGGYGWVIVAAGFTTSLAVVQTGGTPRL